MLCFKLHQNSAIKEEFYFREVKRGGMYRFEKFGKASYRTVVPTRTENIRTLAQL